jgi:hypothetical protein
LTWLTSILARLQPYGSAALSGALAHWRVLAISALAVVAALAMRTCSVERSRADVAEHAVARAGEAAELRDAGVEVAVQVEDLGPALQAALEWAQGSDDKNHVLEDELARVRKAAPTAKPVAVVTASTGPVPVSPPVAPVVPGAGQAPASPPLGPPVPPCLLRPGDTGEVRVAEVRLVTEAGNTVLAGAAEAWRISPAPAQRLFGGVLKADLGAATARIPPPTPDSLGWGVGPAVGVSDRGVLVGATVESPPLRLPWLGWRVGVVASGTAGPGGTGALASLVVHP